MEGRCTTTTTTTTTMRSPLYIYQRCIHSYQSSMRFISQQHASEDDVEVRKQGRRGRVVLLSRRSLLPSTIAIAIAIHHCSRLLRAST